MFQYWFINSKKWIIMWDVTRENWMWNIWDFCVLSQFFCKFKPSKKKLINVLKTNDKPENLLISLNLLKWTTFLKNILVICNVSFVWLSYNDIPYVSKG